MENTNFINFEAFIISSFFSVLSVRSSIVEKFIFQWLGKETEQERILNQDRQLLVDEQRAISMVDEFAKYSKLQRKINKIDDSLKEIKANKPTQSLVMQFGFGYGVKFALALILLTLCIYYRYTPVFQLAKSIDLMPFTSLICYPNETNQISFYFWAMCCAAAARIVPH